MYMIGHKGVSRCFYSILCFNDFKPVINQIVAISYLKKWQPPMTSEGDVIKCGLTTKRCTGGHIVKIAWSQKTAESLSGDPTST